MSNNELFYGFVFGSIITFFGTVGTMNILSKPIPPCQQCPVLMCERSKVDEWAEMKIEKMKQKKYGVQFGSGDGTGYD